jgi:RNA polymerase sigma-70 factor (sigma-E family)
VGDEKSSPGDDQELAACYTAHALGLFGYACFLARGDRALADDLVQATFEAACRAWCTLQCLSDDQRRGWLRATLANIAVSGFRREAAFPVTRQASPRVAGAAAAAYPGGPYAGPALPIHVGESLVAAAAPGSVPAEWDAEQAVTAMYSTHYRSLVRLAALLVHDVATAEEIVHDSFIAMHGAWRRLRDNDKALSYLRQSVVNRSRLVRHGVVVDKKAPKPAPDMPSAERGGPTSLERRQVVEALRSLPSRQREALVLRYYGDLSEAQIASAMGISRGAVKSHTARAIASLCAVLEKET